MFSKLAINNVKRSFRDYSIYFLTLTFAVCIFYSFNSIEAQESMIQMGTSTKSYMVTLNKFIAGISVFVSFILAGLIAYANNFLIKRRKKELGIYMILGMPKSKVSRILVIETLLIGLISLAAGILLGIIVSQGLSVITARLLMFDTGSYRFIISWSSIIKSIAYFGMIFLIVMIFNQITISRYKLLDMINAAKKNEEVRIKNPTISIVIFILSLITLGAAYIIVVKVGLNNDDNLFMLSILLGAIGTGLFFFSLSSFVVLTLQKRRSIYLKDLNIFILRQINNKINTNFLSMTAVCLMIFLTISLLFTMFSFKGSYDRMIVGNTSFDASAQLYEYQENQVVTDIRDFVDISGLEFDEDERHAFFDEYKLDLTVSDLLSDYLTKEDAVDLSENYMDGPVSAIRSSQYDSLLQLKGQQPSSLSDCEILIVSNYGQMNAALDDFMEKESIISIDGKDYTIKNEEPIKENIVSTGSRLDFFYIVVPDSFTGNLTPESTGFNVMFDGDEKESKEKFASLFTALSEKPYSDGKFLPLFGHTIEQVHLRVYGSTTMIIFLGVYLGIVFLVSSAAVLALQQLSDASDSLERYRSLRKIGVTERLINKSILIQNSVYFIIPLALAIIHSIVAMTVINTLFRTYSKSLMGSSLLGIALTLFIIYGGYFYATYTGFKNIIRNSN